MSSQTMGYKAKAFEPRNLVRFFLIVFGLQVLRYGLIIFGFLKEPSSEGLSAGPGVILMFLATWGPTITAFVLMAIVEGKTGVKALWMRFWNRNISIKWLLVILLFLPALWLTTNLVSRILDGQTYPIFYQPGLFIPAFIAGIFTGINEEFGWRGYVLPRFQVRWNALTSSLILGVIWASWHFGQWFMPERNRQDNIWGFTLWIIINSIFLTWIFNNTQGNILGAVLFHAMMNSTNILFWWCGSAWLFYSVYVFAAILILIIFGPKHLVRQKPEERT